MNTTFTQTMAPKFLHCIKWAGASALVLLGGCVNRLPTIEPASDIDYEEASNPFVCASAEHCALSWRKAQFWVVSNASTKIQLATDTVIQTYNTGGTVYGWSYLVTRQPGKAGQDIIDVEARCHGVANCRVNPVVKVAAFKRYLRAAQ